jgi:PAS domain S-box-containing protein
MKALQDFTRRSMALRYGAAAGSAVFALLARMALNPQLGDQLPFVTFFAGIAAAAWFGGVGPAILSAALGFALAELFLVHHVHAWWLLTTLDVAIAASYVVVALTIVILTQAMHSARECAITRRIELEREIGERIQAEEALRKGHDELESRVRQRTAELNHALEAWQHEQRRLDNVLELLPVCVALLTPDHHVSFANRMFRERFGEAHDRHCFETNSGLNAPSEFCENYCVLETMAPREWESACPDGSVYQVFAFPYKDNLGAGLILEVKIDITELKRAHATVSEQAALLQLARDAIIVTDLDGNISFWNRGAEETYGWRPEEAVGKNIREFLQTTPSIPLDDIRAAIHGQGHWEGELAHVTRGGQTVIVASRWALRRDDQGKPSAVLEINRDITDRKRAEEELRLSRQRLALAMKAGHSGAFEWDIQNNIHVWSPEIEELYGIAPGELGNKSESWESLLLPPDLETARAAIQESLTAGELRSEWRVRRHNDGQIRWLAAHATVFFDDTGRPLRMVGIHMDITDRKGVEDALRQSEERYRALVTATSQIVWTTDSNGLVIDNPSWGAFTGQSADQAKEWGWADALHPDDRERISALWSEAVRTQTIFETEYRIRRRDGEFLDVSARGVPVLRADGSVREWVGICTDSTERKRAEEALIRRTRELERSNAELQQFAYVASHDLQEPLRTVANFTQLLAERYASQLDDDARDFIAFAVDGAVRMQALIQALLAYSRVGTKGRVLEPVDCNEALGRAVSNLRISIAENAAQVSHEELPVIQADATQLVQLFQNLIGNGIKFKGVNPPRVHVSAVRQADYWTFSVRDNGIGIEAQYDERIFDIFQRLHHREEYPGTGIGLAVCKKIVERHGGKIGVESEPGNGSTFFFSIPAAGKEARVATRELEVKQHG